MGSESSRAQRSVFRVTQSTFPTIVGSESSIRPIAGGGPIASTFAICSTAMFPTIGGSSRQRTTRPETRSRRHVEPYDRCDESWRHAGFTCVTAPSVRIGSDPDLAGVRAARTAFAEPTSAKFEWAIDWELFSDDICLTSKFPFPLAGVTFDARLTSTGNAEWWRRFTTDRIRRARGAHRYRRVVSTAGRPSPGAGGMVGRGRGSTTSAEVDPSGKGRPAVRREDRRVGHPPRARSQSLCSVT